MPDQPKGKGKSKSSPTPRMPVGLIGFRHLDSQGRPLCFNFNLGKCPVEGASCEKGQHSCAACGLPGHALSDCPKQNKKHVTPKAP
eukprot:725810-Amphidinium_carterae.2